MTPEPKSDPKVRGYLYATPTETSEPASSSPTYSALPVVCATYAQLPEFLTYSGLARLAATTPSD